MTEQTHNTFTCDDLDRAIEEYRSLGYRLDMISPADDPREALLSKNGETLRLTSGSELRVPNSGAGSFLNSELGTENSEQIWVMGRAGMEYRDLLPDRLGGRVIASHIRLTKGGVVPDYVHYHKVHFQMIYCTGGRIRVVYEDQGPPFWLETGDCVLQPPEIRHRVLECSAGAEVLEIGVPAVHETWVAHEMRLPTPRTDNERDFGGQRFVRHVAAKALYAASEFTEFESCDTGIAVATNGSADVHVLRSQISRELPQHYVDEQLVKLFFRLGDREALYVRINV